MILLDTSGVLAAIDHSQRDHAGAAAALAAAPPPRLLSPIVLAELDYLLATRVGEAAELAFLDEVARGAYRLEPFTGTDVAEARTLLERYSGSGLGSRTRRSSCSPGDIARRMCSPSMSAISG